MEKDFDGWNSRKKELEHQFTKMLAQSKKTKKSGLYFHEREIWWCSVGCNLGYEACGKNEQFERPVLVIRKYSSMLFLGTPLTSVDKKDRFHLSLNSVKYHINKTDETIKPKIMLSQLKSLSSVRLIRYMGKISRSELKKVRDELHKWV